MARLALPETKICLMSSHGSEGTAQALPSVVLTQKDKEMTEIYSWIEFDGLMYLYQNSISGNEKMMKWLSGSSEKTFRLYCLIIGVVRRTGLLPALYQRQL